MNSLSWLLYVASIGNGLSVFFGVFGVIFIAITVIACLVFLLEKDMLPPRKLFALPIIGGLMIIISILIPGEKTIMYIAASEYGEKVIRSQEVKDIANPAMDLLKNWMSKESARLAKEVKDK